MVRALIMGTLLLGLTVVANANTPLQQGTNAGNAIKLPGEGNTPVARTGGQLPKSVWIECTADSADAIEIELKCTEEPGGGTDKLKVENVQLVTEEGAQDIGGAMTNDGEATRTRTRVNHGGPIVNERVKIHLATPLTKGKIARINLKVAYRPPLSNEWDWETDVNITFNIYLLDGNHERIEPAKAGNRAKGAFGDAFQHHDINPDPVEVTTEQSPGPIAAPDLVVAEVNGGRLAPGMLVFVPPADATFINDSLSAMAVDRNGTIVTDASRIELGAPVISDGLASIEVIHRDPADSVGVAVVLSGLHVNVPQLRTTQTIGYAVGGTAVRGWALSTADLVTTGESTTSVTISSAIAEVSIDPTDPSALGSAILNHGPFVVQADHETVVEGFLPAIVLEESNVDGFQQGTVTFYRLDDFHPQTNSATKVYILDASDDSNVANAFASVTLSIADGNWVLTLGNRLATGTRLKIVLANPYIAFGEGQFALGQNARIAVGGTGLPAPVAHSVAMIEAAPLDDPTAELLLPAEPLPILNWVDATGN